METKVNKTLSLFQKKIPYIPELRSICGDSLTASILMQQLEYWFSRNECGFYKFLSPCQHEQYREGDSWCEELGFSKDEFRTAFKKIGQSYRSKSQMVKSMENDADPFGGKMYMSFYEPLKGTTTYLRNHDVVDQVLYNLVRGEPNNDKDLEGEDSRHTDVGQANIRGLAETISCSGDAQAAYKEQRLQAENTTEITAARNRCVNSDSYKQVAAASHYFSKNSKSNNERSNSSKHGRPDNQIRETLSCDQAKYVEHVVSHLSKLQGIEYQQLFDEVVHVLLSPKCFSNAGNDFGKKLNTIKRVIKSGSWTSPTAVIEKKQQAVQEKVSPLVSARDEAAQEVRHWSNLLSIVLKRGDKEQGDDYQKLLSLAKSKFKKYQKEYEQFINKKQLVSG